MPIGLPASPPRVDIPPSRFMSTRPSLVSLLPELRLALAHLLPMLEVANNSLQLTNVRPLERL